MHPLERIKQAAKEKPLRVVLPEATDERMLQAARKATDEKVAVVQLLGDPSEIQKAADAEKVSLDGIEIVDVANHPKKGEWAEYFSEKRKKKGLTVEQAQEILADPLFYGAMMVHKGESDGMVAGAINATGNVIRASLQIIGMQPGMKTVSSCFLMIVPDCEYGEDGVLVYGDCGVVPDPNEEQLADIAVATAQSTQALVGIEPVVAMLSFSTYGSAKHPLVDKVTKATAIVKEKQPDLKVDGELQADAAIIAAIGKRKAPESTVAGKANTLIFPDLNAGNICYKITERLAKAEAYGPLLQGLALPVNDLSRGCSDNDIYNSIAITCVQAQAAQARANS